MTGPLVEEFDEGRPVLDHQVPIDAMCCLRVALGNRGVAFAEEKSHWIKTEGTDEQRIGRASGPKWSEVVRRTKPKTEKKNTEQNIQNIRREIEEEEEFLSETNESGEEEEKEVEQRRWE